MNIADIISVDKNMFKKYLDKNGKISSSKINNITEEDREIIYKVTSFITFECKISLRINHILKNILCTLKCENCGRELTPKNSSWYENNFCSVKCASNSESKKNKIKETNIKKYGCECGLNNLDIREKIKKTNIEKYGCENPFGNDKIKDKIKETNIEKYGVDNPSKSKEVLNKIENTFLEKYGQRSVFYVDSIKEKIKKTNVERYGTENYLKSKDAVKIKKTNIEKYGCENPFGNDKIKEKIKETNIEKYGVDNYFKSRPFYEKMGFTNLEIWEENGGVREKGNGICLYEGCNNETGWNRSRKAGKFYVFCEEHFYCNKSSYEYLILNYVKDINIVENTREIIPPLELDIYLPDHRLAIEINGLYWHSEQHKEKEYHYNKYLECKKAGITLLQFYEDEIRDKFEIVLSMINTYINRNDSLYARFTEVKEVSKEEEKQFLDNNHLQEYTRSEKCYGLYYGDDLVSVMSIRKPFTNQGDRLELARFCNKVGINVVGGFSKLLKKIKQYLNGRELITYCDLRYHRDNSVYDKYFTFAGFTGIGYDYVNHGYRENRFKYRARECRTERDVAEENKVYRIYNCGNYKYILNN